MYESPIKVVFSDLVSDSVKKTDEYIVACVQQVGVKVDKDELVKALKFDRGQYEKGWNDRDNEIVRCKDCVYCKRFNDVWYLPKRDELLCTRFVETYHTTENDFCSRGERRAEKIYDET